MTDITISDKSSVEAALAAYEGLSEAVKVLLTSEKTQLDALLVKIRQLEEAAVVKKTDLEAAISAANTAKTGVVVDTDAANVPVGSDWVTQAVMTALENAISAANTVVQKADATQTEVDSAITALNNAVTTFNSAKAPGTKTTPPTSGKSSITLNLSDRGAGAFSQDSFTLSKSSGETQEITLTGNWDSQKWVVDGKQKGTGTSLEVKATDYSIGKHSLTVTVVKGGVPWSKTLPFTVQE